MVDLPDNVTAAAIGLAVGASGLTSVRTIVLLTPEEIDAAASKHAEYRGPGRSRVRRPGADRGGAMDFGAHLPLMDFGGHPFTLDHLVAYARTAAELGFAAVSVNDHMVFSVPWLDGPTALAP